MLAYQLQVHPELCDTLPYRAYSAGTAQFRDVAGGRGGHVVPAVVASKQTGCFTSTEARWLIWDGERGGGVGGRGVGRGVGGGRGETVSGSTALSDPEDRGGPWTTARTTAMLRQRPRPLAIA